MKITLLALALTDVHIDKIFALVDRLLTHSEKWFTLIGLIVLIYRQHRNKKDTDKKIQENTDINVQSLEVANGRSQRIDALTKEIAAVVVPDSPVVKGVLANTADGPHNPVV